MKRFAGRVFTRKLSALTQVNSRPHTSQVSFLKVEMRKTCSRNYNGGKRGINVYLQTFSNNPSESSKVVT